MRLFLFTLQVLAIIFTLPAYGKELSYARLVQERITAALDYPEAARARGLQGQVTLNLGLLPNGDLEEIFIGQSSGHELLDKEAMKSAQRAAPYPPFPKEIREPLIWIEVPIIYGNETSLMTKPGIEEFSISHRARGNDITLGSPGDNTPLGLTGCLEIALANSITTQIAQEQIRLASLKLREARRGLYPSMAGEWKSTDGQTLTDPFESKSYGIEVEQTVYDAGKSRHTFRQEELGMEIARRNYQRVKGELYLSVAKAYYEFAKSQMLAENQNNLLREVRTYLDLITREHELGLSTEAEFLEVQSLWEQVSYQGASLEGDFALARLVLKQALNLDPEENIEINALPVVPREDMSVANLANPVTLGDYLGQAFEIRPELAIMEMSVDSARYGQRIAKRQNRPKLSMVSSVGQSGEAYSAEDLTMAQHWSVMGKVSWMFGGSSLEYSRTSDKVTATEILDVSRKTEATTDSFKFSLLNNMAYFTGEKEADIVYQQTMSELNDTKEKIRMEVEEAYFNYGKAVKGLNLARERIGFRQKQFAVLKAKMNVGEAGIPDLFRSRIELADEISFHIQSMSNYYLAKATLAWATGQVF